jgi:hypothetical protein
VTGLLEGAAVQLAEVENENTRSSEEAEKSSRPVSLFKH